MQTFLIKKGLCNMPQAREIRQEIFVEEQGFKIEFDETDEFAHHLLVYIDGAAVATGRLFGGDAPNEFHIGRVAVRKPYRKMHLGAFVVETLEAHAKTLGANKIVLSAQMQALEFYEKLGYKKYGEIYKDEHCPHIDMEKAI